MTNDERVKLWDAINRYATACGGDTSGRHTSEARMDAVAETERVVREEVERPILDARDRAEAAWQDSMEAVVELEAENHRLREALGPFAELSREWYADGASRVDVPTVLLQRAAQALKEK